MSLVIFSHGKESGPKGTKINILSEIAQKLGFKTLSIDYTKCKDANERVFLLHKTITESNDSSIVLVGSSMGGYVSTVIASDLNIEGLFLMCPALYIKNYAIQEYAPKTSKVEIIHGWKDKIVPFQNSVKFGKQIEATLHLIEDNHRLSNSHAFLKHTFELFLLRI
ncbi:MAG: alpha/beta hydrolase [Aureispira sp.]|nr:alpha/beta hydrolase [Aureispira sp.]